MERAYPSAPYRRFGCRLIYIAALKADLDKNHKQKKKTGLMDAGRSVVPQTGVEAEDKQRRLIWDPAADAKQIPPSRRRRRMSAGSHAGTYQRVPVDVGPLDLLGLLVVLHHGPAQDVQVLLRGIKEDERLHFCWTATRGRRRHAVVRELTWVLILMAPMDGIS